jgi:L-threonylcarbamoyladenylate synthase
VVAFATDTVYGLAVDPGSDSAVRALFDLKGRDARAAVPLLAASVRQVTTACGSMAGVTAHLAQTFWPGPLSLVFDAPAAIAAGVHGGNGTVAIRVPASQVARALAEAFCGLVTATSANRSGEPPASTPAALDDWLDDERVLLVDSGAAPGGAPSTIVDARGARPMLIREGAITWNRVLESLEA